MGLTRQDMAFRTGWEVDHSGLVVSRLKGGVHWMVSELFPMPPEPGYLTRNRLEGRRFPTRARAVDAVRMALSKEPRHLPPITRWRKHDEGIYHSTDEHWRLSRSADFSYRLLPMSAQAQAALQYEPAQEVRLSWSSWRSHTLDQCAQRVDRLNLDLELGTPCGRVGPFVSR